MNARRQRTALIRLHLDDKNLLKPALEDLTRDRTLSVNILRGRITQADASFEIEVTGRARRIKKFIQSIDDWRASVGASSAGVA